MVFTARDPAKKIFFVSNCQSVHHFALFEKLSSEETWTPPEWFTVLLDVEAAGEPCHKAKHVAALVPRENGGAGCIRLTLCCFLEECKEVKKCEREKEIQFGWYSKAQAANRLEIWLPISSAAFPWSVHFAPWISFLIGKKDWQRYLLTLSFRCIL